jgi:putative heme-binding domain-containing protein
VGLLVLLAGEQAASAGGKAADDMSDDPAAERRLMQLPPGFEMQLVAAEPDIVNPIAMNFDTRGRLWVVCAPRYPQILPGQKPADYVVVLDDFDARGKARSAKVFATGLTVPTGLAPGDGGVYVGQAHSLLHFREDGKGKVERRVLLTGLGTQDTHHTLNTFRWGPGGSLYFNQGIYIKSTVETPFGPRKLFGGCVWHLRTDRLRLEVFDRSILDNNTWGHAFDEWGQSILSSAWPADLNLSLPDSPLYPTDDRSLITPLKLTKIGGGRHCGLEIVSGRHFPDDWQGNLLTGDFLTHRIQRYRLSDDGQRFTTMELPPLVVSKHRKFRPVDVKMGPDGAVYVADLYQQIIQHNQIDFRDPRRDHRHGRIWRIVRKDRPLVPRPKLVDVPVARVLDHFKDSEQWTRLMARRALAERDGKEVAVALADWVKRLHDRDPNAQRHLLEALWTYQAIDVVNEPLLARLLHADNPRARAAATRVLGAWSDRIGGAVRLLARQAADPNGRVRLEAVLAASRIPNAAAAQAALHALDLPTDPLLDFVLRRTVVLLKPHWYPEFQAGRLSFGGRARALTFALQAIRAPDALPKLTELYRAGKVARENRADVLGLLAALGDAGQQALAFDQALAADRLGTAERARVLEALRQVARARPVRPAAPGQALAADRLGTAERARVLEALRQVARARPVRPAADLGRVASLFGSADAALSAAALRLAGAWKLAKLRPELDRITSEEKTPGPRRQAAIIALVDLGGPESVRQLEALAAAGRPYALRADALAGLAALDVQKAARLAVPLLRQPAGPGHDPSAVFTAFLQRAGGPAALAAALKEEPPSADAAKVGLRVLNGLGVPAPALLSALQAATGETGQARKLDAEGLRRLIALVQKQGDAARGEAVFRRTALGCVNCHAIAGVGARVGPDLATIGTSAPLDYLIESILLPSKVVKEGYTTATVVTKDGKALTGILLRETPRALVLRDPTHDEIVIPKADIEEHHVGGSLMPSGLDQSLSDAELADLVRFLSELGRPGPYALSHVPVARRWQYLTAVPRGLRQLDDAALGKALADGRLTWEPVYSLVSGPLPLAEATKDDRGVAVVRCQVEVAAAGKVELVFNERQGLQLWVDGAPVAAGERVALDLGRGMHTLTVWAEVGRRKDARLRCELAVPPGSPAQATFVVGR